MDENVPSLQRYRDVAQLTNIHGFIRDNPTCVMEATRRQNTRVLALFLENGADPSPKCTGGFTPLHVAAANGDVEVVDLLVLGKADVDAKDDKIGGTPLHVAATAGYAAIMLSLLRARANPDVRSAFGRSPLHVASLHGQAAAVRILLVHKANPLLVHEGRVALETAVIHGHSSVVEQFGLTLGFEVCGGRTKGESCLRLAAEIQNSEILMMLVLGGVKDEHGHALCKSLSVGDEESFKILLSASENPKEYVNEARLATRNLSTLECCMMPSGLRLTSGRIVRRLLDAGMCASEVEGEFITSVAPSSSCDHKALGLNQILRLVLQEPAIHALSWGWPTRADNDKRRVILLQSSVKLQRATKKKLVTVLLAGLSRKKMV